MEQNKAERLNENVTEKMCSSDGNVVGEMCSPADADTCGDGVPSVTKQVKKYRNRLKKGIPRDLLKLAVSRNPFFCVLTIAS